MNIINKYKVLPLQLKSSMWYVVCSVLQRGISIITLPIFTRILTTEAYGQVAIYTTWMGLFSIFLSLNLPYGSFQTAMIKFEDDRAGYISSINGIFILLSAVFFAIYFPFVSFWNNILDLTTPLVIFLVLETVANSTIQCWLGQKKFEYKYVGVIVVTLLLTVISQATTLLFVFIFDNKGLVKIIGNASIIIVFGAVFYVIYLFKGKKFFNKKYWVYAFKFNIPLIVYYLSQVVYNQSDKIMIKKMCGESQVGIYSVAYNFGMILTFVVSAITASYMPWFYEKLKQHREIEDRKVSLSLSFLLSIPLLLIVAATPEIIYIMASEKYMEAIWIVPPIAVSVLLLFYADIFDRIFFYYENKIYLTIATVIAGIINIVLNYLLIPIYGYYAAAYTTLASYVILVILDLVFSLILAKKNNLNAKMYNLKGMFLLFIVLFSCSAGLMLLYNYIYIRYSIILAVIVLTIVFRKKIIEIIKKIREKDESIQNGEENSEKTFTTD